MTNDTKAATDELFEHFARISEKANGVEMEVWFANRDAVRAGISAQQAEITGLRGLLVKGDSYLSLLRHRYIRTDTPDDLRQDVDRVIGAIRNASKGEL